MNINALVFEKVKAAKSKILVVTKYYKKLETAILIKACEQNFSSVIFGYGENRIEGIKDKGINYLKLHFIGNLQSKKLKNIATYCSVVHSLDSLRHAEVLDVILGEMEKGKRRMKVFLQIKLDKGKPTGIDPKDLPKFIEAMKVFENLEVVGISGMGQLMGHDPVSLDNKRKEFQLLLDLRDRYLPKKIISAGTTQDYEMALKMGIDVVRVGRGVVL